MNRWAIFIFGLMLSTSALGATVRIDVDSSLTNSSLFNWNPVAAENWARSVVQTAGLQFGDLQLNITSIKVWQSTSPFDPSNSATLVWTYEDWLEITPPERREFNIVFSATAGTGGGAAIQNSACEPYAIAAIRVPVNLGSVLIFERARNLTIHEFGHTLDLDHSHCQATPLDQCWSGGNPAGRFGGDCYVGSLSCPTEGRGTAMSICFDGGCSPSTNLPNFHPVQQTQLQNSVQSKSCLSGSLFVDGFENDSLRRHKSTRYIIE